MSGKAAFFVVAGVVVTAIGWAGWSSTGGAAVSAPAQEVYTYDFESGTAGWELDPAVWSLVEWGGGHALRGEGHGFVRLTEHSGEVSRLSFRFALGSLMSGMHANVLDNIETGGSRYMVRLATDGVYLSRQDGSDTFTDLGHGYFPIAPQVPYQAEIFVGHGSLDVFINGEGVVGVDDPSPPAPGYVSFETLDDALAYVDDVEVQIGAESTPHTEAPRPPLSLPTGPDVGPFVAGVHTGTVTLTGTTALTLTQGRYTMKAGEILMRDNARLYIGPDAVLVFDRDGSPLIHWGLDLKQSSALVLDGGRILAAPRTLARIITFDNSSITIQNAAPWIHFINSGGNAQIHIRDSRFVTSIGGSIGLSGNAVAEVERSQIGAVSFHIPAGGTLTATGLRPGYFPDFNLQRDVAISGVGYNLVLRDSEIVTDTLGAGPFERGWVVSADEDAAVALYGSTLRKLVLDLPASGPAEATVSGFHLGVPTDGTLLNVTLTDVIMNGQWGFSIRGSRQVTFEDCDGLWLFLFDTSRVMMRRSEMNEFDPRQYRGVLAFDDGEWDYSGEIIDNNAFLITGTAQVDDAGLQQSLSWSQSVVTREFPIEVLSPLGTPLAGTAVTLTRGSETVSAVTDGNGRAAVRLRFGDADYKQAWQLTTSAGHDPLAVGFFSDTPIVVQDHRLYLPLVLRAIG